MDTESDVLCGHVASVTYDQGSLSIRRTEAAPPPPLPAAPETRVASLPLKRLTSFLEAASRRNKKFESASRALKERKDTPELPSPVAAERGEGGRGRGLGEGEGKG